MAIIPITIQKEGIIAMHYLKRIYCRTVHVVCRLAKPFLPYKEPVLLNGIEEIYHLLKKENKKSVLLVTDEYLHVSGATYPLENMLQNADIRCVVYDKQILQFITWKKPSKCT